MTQLSRRGLLAALAGSVALAACVQTGTQYDAPVARGVSAAWRIADARVSVPEALVVSEEASIFPKADIVWREDPAGDRKAQVSRIVRDAARAGGAGLRGGRPVYLDVSVRRFHALTFEAERFLSVSGVHDITLVVQVTDARTGEVLAGPAQVEASLPALSGNEMIQARLRGETQKSQISAHLRRVFAGWLGIGPDPRGGFERLGG